MVNYSSFASFAPHALNQRSPAEGKGKGQKLLAQGNALGLHSRKMTPCKGKSLIYIYLITINRIHRGL